MGGGGGSSERNQLFRKMGGVTCKICIHVHVEGQYMYTCTCRLQLYINSIHVDVH